MVNMVCLLTFSNYELKFELTMLEFPHSTMVGLSDFHKAKVFIVHKANIIIFPNNAHTLLSNANHVALLGS